MALLNIGNPKEFLLLVHNFNMSLEVSVTLQAGAKAEFFCTIFCREVLHQFDLLFENIGSSTPLTLEAIILVFCAYIFFCLYAVKAKVHNAPQNEEAAQNKSKTYTARLVDLNKYLDSFPGARIIDKIVVTKLNRILLDQSGVCSGILL